MNEWKEECRRNIGKIERKERGKEGRMYNAKQRI